MPISSGPFPKPPSYACGRIPPRRNSLPRLEKKHSKGKALTILAHKLARAVYYMLQTPDRF